MENSCPKAYFQRQSYSVAALCSASSDAYVQQEVFPVVCVSMSAALLSRSRRF